MKSQRANVSAQSLESLINEVRRFRECVVAFDDEFERRLNRLGETFCDEAYQAFRNQADHARRKLRKFEQETSIMLPRLTSDLEAVRSVQSLDDAQGRSR